MFFTRVFGEISSTFSSLSFAFLERELEWMAKLAMLFAYGRLQRPPERVGRATMELRGTPLAGSVLTREEGFETLIDFKGEGEDWMDGVRI